MPEQSESQLGFGALLLAIDTHAPPFLNPGEDFLQPWGRYWVPFLTNDSGDYVVIDASPTRNGEAIEYWHDMDDRNVSYPSLAEWAAGLIDEFRRRDA